MSRRLLAALSTLLPSAEQTLLLRACLHDTDGAAAWAELDRRLGREGTRSLLTSNRRLLPLLHRAPGPALPPDVRRQLTAVSLRESERAAAFRRGSCAVIETLAAGGAEVLVLRGAALAALAYPEPSLRHCHDLDLLVRGDAAGAAGAASVHRSAFAHRRAQGDDGQFWARSWASDFGGVRARVMAPADLLAHVCGHAYLSERRDSLTWITDAWFTMAVWPDLDWEAVALTAADRHLGAGLAVLLGYLERELGAPVPPAFVQRLHGLAVEPVDRDIALALAWGAARRRAPSRTRAVLSAGAGAPSLVRWRILPSLR
jgi:hypothetical protein